jgi:hypothetical protein
MCGGLHRSSVGIVVGVTFITDRGMASAVAAVADSVSHWRASNGSV